MTVLVVGATGATGRLLVERLLSQGHRVRSIVRSVDRVPEATRSHPRITHIEANLLDLSDAQLAAHVEGCSAIACLLGHRLSFQGIFGPPRRLVTDATRRLCGALKKTSSGEPRRYVLMNTAGNRNGDLEEPISFAQQCVVGLIRAAVPPHADNEDAAEFLRVEIGQADADVEWAAVRPDSLVDEDTVTEYEIYPSPTRSAIFNPGTTSRINVASFMAALITDSDLWQEWKGRMPVIYNKAIGPSN